MGASTVTGMELESALGMNDNDNENEEASPGLNEYVSRDELMRLEQRFLNNERTLLARLDRVEEKLAMGPDQLDNTNMSLTNTVEKINRESDMRRDEMFFNDANDIKFMITQF